MIVCWAIGVSMARNDASDETKIIVIVVFMLVVTLPTACCVGFWFHQMIYGEYMSAEIGTVVQQVKSFDVRKCVATQASDIPKVFGMIHDSWNQRAGKQQDSQSMNDDQKRASPQLDEFNRLMATKVGPDVERALRALHRKMISVSVSIALGTTLAALSILMVGAELVHPLLFPDFMNTMRDADVGEVMGASASLVGVTTFSAVLAQVYARRIADDEKQLENCC